MPNSKNPGEQHPGAYWVYLFLTYALTGLGWVVAAWAIFKVGMVMWIGWIALTGGPEDAFQVVPDCRKTDLGLRPLIQLSRPTLWLGLFGSIYVILLRSAPVIYTSLDGSDQWYLPEGQGGYSRELLGIDWFLLIAFFVVAVFGLWAWYRAIGKLAANCPPEDRDCSHPIALGEWGQIVILALALAFPFVMRELEEFPALNDTMNAWWHRSGKLHSV